MIIHGLDTNTIYYSNTGSFIILEEVEPTIYNSGKKDFRVRIRFLENWYGFNYEKTYSTKMIRKGLSNITIMPRNPYYPSLYNIACTGIYDKQLHAKKIKYVWKDMISRCYNPYDKAYKLYGAKGVKVCYRWLCYEYFLEDLSKMEHFDDYRNIGSIYQLDKDCLQQNIPVGQRIYSLKTCILIPNYENSKLANIKTDGYYCVQKYNNNYQARLSKNYDSKYLGMYSNEIAAAIVRDNYLRLNYPNDYTCIYNFPDRNYPMKLTDAVKYRTKSEIMCYQEMCEVVE